MVDMKHQYKSIEQPLRAENSVGAGPASEKQTIKTLEEAPEGPPLNVIVKPQDSETLKLLWKVGNYNLYTVLSGSDPTHQNQHKCGHISTLFNFIEIIWFHFEFIPHAFILSTRAINYFFCNL